MKHQRKNHKRQEKYQALFNRQTHRVKNSFLFGGKEGTAHERQKHGAQKNQQRYQIFRLVKPHTTLYKTLAERGGFEPSVGCPTPDFESGTIGRSVISPIAFLYQRNVRFTSQAKRKRIAIFESDRQCAQFQ